MKKHEKYIKLHGSSNYKALNRKTCN